MTATSHGNSDRRCVVISGAASGIGAAAARAFLNEGDIVVAGDVDAAGLAAVRQSLPGDQPQRLLPVELDVTSAQSVANLAEVVAAEVGHVDVLFNNAGIAPVGSCLDTSEEVWRRVMEVDLDGAFKLARAMLPFLMETRGNIVNTASVSGLGADYNYAAYNAAKGAVINFTRSLAVDYGKSGVRVNAVAPGPVRTPLLERNLDQLQGLENAFATFVPLGRIAEPEEVSAVVLFLASGAASFVTGAIVTVDGGVTAWNGQPNGDLVGR